ncbi:hypothetical protein CR51_23515 [Caballeronia megalochromosomata]|nr:hypothetical protein CR51_23515 [Caballeronia megalochromosomata]
MWHWLEIGALGAVRFIFCILHNAALSSTFSSIRREKSRGNVRKREASRQLLDSMNDAEFVMG